jgi:hypothetical protein
LLGLRAATEEVRRAWYLATPSSTTMRRGRQRRCAGDPEIVPPALDLGKLRSRTALSGLVDADEADHLLIADDDRRAAVDHRSHGQFGLRWHADLSHQDEVDWRLELGRDLRGDGNAAARQCQDHRPLPLVAGKRRGELTSRVRSVLEAHRVTPRPIGLLPACRDGAQTSAWHAR